MCSADTPRMCPAEETVGCLAFAAENEAMRQHSIELEPPAC